MDKTKISYKIARFLAMITLGLVYPFKVLGRENVPEGAAVVCANHSSWTDPVLLAFAIPGKFHLCLMAKKELFKSKFAAWFFKKIGTFSVDRSAADMDAMKNAMLCLKSGKKLGIFPEGTRSSEDGEVAPKVGAVRLAERNNAPLVPVYIPRSKKRFHRTTVVIGEPIYIEKIKGRRTKEQYDELADELMTKITQLGQQPSKATGA